MISHLFAVNITANDLCDHPPELGLDKAKFPLGPLRGWECFGPTMRQDNEFFVLREPVLEIMHGGVCIVYRPPGAAKLYADIVSGQIEFFFGNHHLSRDGAAQAHRACWYQSGQVLRFLRLRS